MEIAKLKPLHKVIKTVKALAFLQTQTQEIAIPYILGPPGIAKTAMLVDMCRKEKWNLLVTHYGLRPIEEVSGIPNFQNIELDGKTVLGTQWSLPDILTDIYRINDPNKITIWFLDDMHLASPSLIALGYELFSERKLRGHQIPPNVAFVLAGNTSSKAGAKTMFSAVINRCAMLPVYLDFNQWKNDYAFPMGLNSKIISFLSNSKNQRYAQEEEKINMDAGWASFRSWTRFSNLLNPMEEFYKDVPTDQILYYGAAHVGEEAASEFSTYYKIFSQVETVKIFKREIPIKVPDDLTGQYVYTMANISEFFNLYLKKDLQQTAKNDLIQIMSEILLELANVRTEMATTGLKEIAVTESALHLRNIYIKIHTNINMKNPTIAARISKDITII